MPTLLPASEKTRQTRPGRNVDARMRPSEEVLTPAAEALSARAASVRGPRISNQCRTRLAFVRLLSQFALVSPSCVGLARIQATSRARGAAIVSVDGLGRISLCEFPLFALIAHRPALRHAQRDAVETALNISELKSYRRPERSRRAGRMRHAILRFGAPLSHTRTPACTRMPHTQPRSVFTPHPSRRFAAIHLLPQGEKGMFAPPFSFSPCGFEAVAIDPVDRLPPRRMRGEGAMQKNMIANAPCLAAADGRVRLHPAMGGALNKK